MMPDEIPEVIAKVLFFLFATIVLCMSQAHAVSILAQR